MEPVPFEKPIYITRPLLPPLDEFVARLRRIWDSQWLTNFGQEHDRLEAELERYMGVKHVSLCANGTVALELACACLGITGEVITTPFTFPATVHSITAKHCTPVFADISTTDFNIDPDEIEKRITPRTTAIMPVHVFGMPCDIKAIQEIADHHDLKVIYDAAHCFGVELDGKPIGSFGDMSMFSFHAAKIFHTFEGGALTFDRDDFKDQLRLLKNFGIKNEEEVVLPGINGKMNEVQAAMGLVNLENVGREIETRKKLHHCYRELLSSVRGMWIPLENPRVRSNYQYFPVVIDEDLFGISRNKLYEQLKRYNVFARKYFFPVATRYAYYKTSNFPVLERAERVAKNVLCLPLYGSLSIENVEKIVGIIAHLHRVNS